MMKHFLSIFLLSSIFLTPFSAVADIYKYTAADGKIYYSDKPKHRYYKRVIRSKGTASRSAYHQQRLRYQPKNKKKYSDIIAQAAIKHSIDESLIHAVIHAESAYNPRAVSSAGAVGLMQLMPATAKRFGVTNRRDPAQNINAGARYLSYLLGLFKSNTRLAVAAYNAGEGAVMKYKNRIPPYPETQKYVRKVMHMYHEG